MRYRDLAALVHPDKNTDPRARDAFEEVKKAHAQLQNKDRRQLCVALIAQAREEVEKRRRKDVKKGRVRAEDQRPLEDDVRNETRRTAHTPPEPQPFGTRQNRVRPLVIQKTSLLEQARTACAPASKPHEAEPSRALLVG